MGALDVDGGVSALSLKEQEKLVDTSNAIASEKQFSSEASEFAKSDSRTRLVSDIRPDTKPLQSVCPCFAAR